jgi:hypothetical protein
MILVRVLDLKFLYEFAAQLLALQIHRTSPRAPCDRKVALAATVRPLV